MKKFLTGFLLAALIFGSTAAFAATQYTAEPASFKVFVNGKEFTPTTGQILVVDGRTYLPLADMGTVLNVSVKWNGDAKQVEVGTPPKTVASTDVVIGDAAQELTAAKAAVTELKKLAKNPTTLILNEVRVFYRYGIGGDPVRFIEIDYTGENSIGGYARGYFYHPTVLGTTTSDISIVDQQKMSSTSISIDLL